MAIIVQDATMYS